MEKTQDITHTLWECKKIHADESCKKLREFKREDIPRNVKLGAPNVMNKKIYANFFGKNANEVETTNNEMLELLGFRTSRKHKQGRADIDGMANRVYDRCGIKADGMNARQAFLDIKQGTPDFEIPRRSNEVLTNHQMKLTSTLTEA